MRLARIRHFAALWRWNPSNAWCRWRSMPDEYSPYTDIPAQVAWQIAGWMA